MESPTQLAPEMLTVWDLFVKFYCRHGRVGTALWIPTIITLIISINNDAFGYGCGLFISATASCERGGITMFRRASVLTLRRTAVAMGVSLTLRQALGITLTHHLCR